MRYWYFSKLSFDKKNLKWIFISYGIWETRSVFYIPSPKARGYKKHNLFHKYRMVWKFISDPIHVYIISSYHKFKQILWTLVIQELGFGNVQKIIGNSYNKFKLSIYVIKWGYSVILFSTNLQQYYQSFILCWYTVITSYLSRNLTFKVSLPTLFIEWKLSFEYEVRSLIIVKIQKYCPGKMLCFCSDHCPPLIRDPIHSADYILWWT